MQAQYIVKFEDLEVDVEAFDREAAQEKALEEAERIQGFSTAIVSIRRV